MVRLPRPPLEDSTDDRSSHLMGTWHKVSAQAKMYIVYTSRKCFLRQ